MKKSIIIYIAQVCTAVVFIMLIISNTVLSTMKYNLTYNDLPDSFDGYKIVQLSDLHSKKFGKNNKNLIKKIDKLEPNLIVMTGDMMNSTDSDFRNVISLCKNLTLKYDVLYVIGNHEQIYSENDLADLYVQLRSVNVTVLDNEGAMIKRGEDTIYIYGLWFNLRYYSAHTKEYTQNGTGEYYLTSQTVQALLGDCNKEKFNILLTHNPVYFDSYCEWGADLILSGHMHGGMIRLPFIGGIYSPEKVFFPKYDAGLFYNGKQKMIVSRGLGSGKQTIRFLNQPEIVMVTMKNR